MPVTTIAISFPPPARFDGRVHVTETPSGAWIVRDEWDRRGGRFQSRKAALYFIRREFGPTVDVMIQPLRAAGPAGRMAQREA